MGLIDDDQDEYTNAVDIWSLGCVSYWLSTQRVPFSSKELIKFTARSTDFPLNPLLNKSVTNEGMIFLRKAIAIQPSERFIALIALDDPWLKDVEPELQATQLVRDNEATQLLRDSHFDIHTVDFDVNKALLWAASRDYEGDTVQLLLRKGADVAAEDDSGQTALHLAASYGRETTVRLLLEKGTDVAAEDDNGRRALHWAASYGRETTVRLLLEKGANIVAKDKNGWTPLHWAASAGHEAIVRLLLEKGADIAAKDKDGWTALHCAASMG
jgi:ankyrin repeat protein